MTAKSFSIHACDEQLAFADALCRQEFGLSYEQYCSTVLLDEIYDTGATPQLSRAQAPLAKERAAQFIREFSDRHRRAAVGELSEKQIRELIARRYE